MLIADPASREVLYAPLKPSDPGSFEQVPASRDGTNNSKGLPGSEPTFVHRAIDPPAELARCFLRLANLPNFALDRLSRYEATLWRQVGQIMFTLDALYQSSGSLTRSGIPKSLVK